VKFGLAQNGAQGSALQISIMIRHCDQDPRLAWVSQKVMAAAHMMQKETGSLQRADQLAGRDDR
jgi:hypothetical protein